jgi:hypothetical protein
MTARNGVLTGPGQTEVTVTPAGRTSAHSASPYVSRKDFAAEYPAEPGIG